MTHSIWRDNASKSCLNELPRPLGSDPRNKVVVSELSAPSELSGRGAVCTGHVLRLGPRTAAGPTAPATGPHPVRYRAAYARVPRAKSGPLNESAGQSVFERQ